MIRSHGFLLAFALVSQTAFAAETFSRQEKVDRVTDQAALSAKRAAIASFDKLLKNPNHEDRKALLMLRLAETLQQTAEIEFRVVASKKPNSRLQDSALMSRSLQVILDLEAMPNRRVDAGRIQYLKSVALRDLGRKAEAIAGFIQFIKDYPNREESPQARFSLAQLQRDTKDYASALATLNSFSMPVETIFEAYRLELLVLTHLDMDDVPGALQAVEWETLRLEKLAKSARYVELERAYDHAIRVYIRALESKTPGVSLDSLYAVLKRMNSGPSLGKPLYEVAATLRVKEWRNELLFWRAKLQEKESLRPEWKEILWVCAEYELNNGRNSEFTKLFGLMQLALKNFPAAQTKDFRIKIESYLLEKSAALTAKIKQVQDTESNLALRTDLNVVFSSFIQIADAENPKVAEVRFNWAENSFKTENYSAATQNYLWLIHDRAKSRQISSIVNEISTSALILKAVASRYEEFRAANRIPKELKAKSLDQDTGHVAEQSLSAWVSWIDRLREYEIKGQGVPGPTLDSFEFEANRMLYQEGQVRLSVERMKKFVDRGLKTPFSAVAGTLVVDTYLLSKKWTDARAVALRTQALLSEKDKELSEKLLRVGSEVTYQLASEAYQNKDYDRVLSECEYALKNLSGRTREKDVLALAVQASISNSDGPKARELTNFLIQKYPQSPEGIDAYRLRAGFAEEDLQYASASQDLRRFLLSNVAGKSGDVSESVVLRKRTLKLAWLSGDRSEVERVLDFVGLCDKNLQEECELYRGLLALTATTEAPLSKDELARYREKAQIGNENNRVIASVLYLRSSQASDREQRLKIVETLAQVWSKVDPLIQITVYPKARDALNKTLENFKDEVRVASAVQTHPSWIRLRTTYLEKFEKNVQVVQQMPWARVQASVFAVVAESYFDFSQDIERYEHTFKDLSQTDRQMIEESLKELKKNIKQKVISQAKQGMEIVTSSGVEEAESLRLVRVLAQYQEDRSQWALPPNDSSRVPRLDAQFMNLSDGKEEWKAESAQDPNIVKRLKGLWVSAIEKGSWQKAAYLMKVAADRKLVPAASLAKAQAVLFDSIGARSEGLAKLEYEMDQMTVAHSQSPLFYMLSLSVHSFSKEKTLHYLDLIEKYWRKGAKFEFSPEQAKLLLYSAQWAQFSLPSNLNASLLDFSKQKIQLKDSGVKS